MVALRWTDSSRLMFFLVCGDQTSFPYSRYGLTRLLKSGTMLAELILRKVLRMVASILLAFLTTSVQSFTTSPVFNSTGVFSGKILLQVNCTYRRGTFRGTRSLTNYPVTDGLTDCSDAADEPL